VGVGKLGIGIHGTAGVCEGRGDGIDLVGLVTEVVDPIHVLPGDVDEQFGVIRPGLLGREVALQCLLGLEPGIKRITTRDQLVDVVRPSTRS
jgi:hypothetical protein